MNRFLNQIIQGDCLEVMKELPDNSVDSIVTDPPYELGFMGKMWDSTGIAYNVEMWQECLRVLKPGGYLLAFGGTRTYHRMTCAIEDAGFEIRDCIQWIYGSGFPKSMDISKQIDKCKRGELVRQKLMYFAKLRGIGGKWLEEKGIASAASFTDWTIGGHAPSDKNWDIVKKALEITNDEENKFEREVIGKRISNAQDQHKWLSEKYDGHKSNIIDITAPATSEAIQYSGWGTALKPANEPIVVARKPLSEKTVAENVLKWGTGGINIDGCRVEFAKDESSKDLARSSQGFTSQSEIYHNNKDKYTISSENGNPQGRFPANVIFDEEAGRLLDEQSGISKSKSGGLSGFDPGMWKGKKQTNRGGHNDSGGASRFFYCAKASKAERRESKHPTVKPLNLMRYLVRLVTPPNGTALDPFAGSGTTLEAAMLEGFCFVGIERQAEYIPDIQARVKQAQAQQSLFA